MTQDYGMHPPKSRILLCLQFFAFAAILIGLKFFIINFYGNEVPYWDQWDAEAAFLYQPYLRGDLSFFDMFAPHNEHRIFTTRVLGLLLLQINGLWSPVLQMVVNAVLHVFSLGTTIWLMSKATNNKNALIALLVFAGILFGVPFGLENTLSGFQAQFYFVLLFSVLAIWWLVTAQVLSGWWWVGVVNAVVAFFSLASGVFALAAAVVIILVRFIFISRDVRDLAGATLLIVLFVVGVIMTPVLPGHAQLKATGILNFLEALNAGLSWPLPENWIFSAVRNLPIAVLVGWVLWKRPSRSNPVWFLVGLAIWFGGQAAAIAYGRANDALASRYLDLHAMGVLVNFAALIAVYTLAQGRYRDAAIVFGCVWMFAIAIAISDSAKVTLPGMLAGKGNAGAVQEANVKRYLADRDVARFRALPYFSIPYPNADRLAGLLDSAYIRAILPKTLQNPIRPTDINPLDGSVFVRGGASPTVPPCDCEFLGSYDRKGNAAIGEASIRYDPGLPPVQGDRVFMMKIAGYPSIAGSIDVIQGDSVWNMSFAKDPRESWIKHYISVRPNEPFVIRLTDKSERSWLAVSEPIPVGRLDPFLSVLLGSYRIFLAVGIAVIGLLFFDRLWRKSA